MSALIKKLDTFKRIGRNQGLEGMKSILKEKTDPRPLILLPLQYARVIPSVFSTVARHGRP